MEQKLSENGKFLSKRENLWSYIDIFLMRCIILDETTIHKSNKFNQKKDILILVSIIRLYPKVNAKILHNGTRKNFLPSASYCLDKSFSLREVDKKNLFGATFGYEDSYLESVSCYSKVSKLYAIPHDQAGAIQLHNGE